MAKSKTKSELLDSLYGLRAGLSVVAQQRDKVDNIINKAVSEKESRINAAKKAADNANSDIDDLDKNLQSTRKTRNASEGSVK